MFKSLFSKYISAFLLINVCSFAVIIAIITSIINGYSQHTQRESIKMITASSSRYIENQLERGESTCIDEYVRANKSSIESMLSAISQNSENITIVISNNDGTILDAFGTSADKISAVPPD